MCCGLWAVMRSCDLWGCGDGCLRAVSCGDGERGSVFNLPPYARTWGYALPWAPLQPRFNCTPTPMPAGCNVASLTPQRSAPFITQCYEFNLSGRGALRLAM